MSRPLDLAPEHVPDRIPMRYTRRPPSWGLLNQHIRCGAVVLVARETDRAKAQSWPLVHGEDVIHGGGMYSPHAGRFMPYHMEGRLYGFWLDPHWLEPLDVRSGRVLDA